MFARILSIIIFISYASTALVAAQDFTISQTVTSSPDTSAPTAPTTVTATGVATDQIDVSWSGATDNIGVVGYQVFRDGLFIATSTIFSYQNTGLTPATSYSYTVRAYDAAFNFSPYSAVAIGTTLTPTVVATSTPPTQSDGTSGSRKKPVLIYSQITAYEYSAVLSWETSIPTRAVVKWGRTREYEMGSLSESAFRADHKTEFRDLSPNTKYYYTIIAENGVGGESVWLKDSFVTKKLPDTEAPPNVKNLHGRFEEDARILWWINPRVEDFTKVRILRRDDGFPSDTYDGELVYEGRGEEFKDTRNKTGVVYYTVFAYDRLGNISSGAVVKVASKGYVEEPAPVSPFASTTTFRFEDLQFFQRNEHVFYTNKEVYLRSGDPFIVSIPYEKLPEHLKTILVILVDPNDTSATFSFLLRINKEKTSYLALIDSLEKEGLYPISIQIFDYKERSMRDENGKLIVEGSSSVHNTKKFDAYALFSLLMEKMCLWWIMVIIILILCLRYLYLKFSSKRDK